MNRLVVLSVVLSCLWLSAQAGASEGRLSELSPAVPETDRQSTYLGGRAESQDSNGSASSGERKGMLAGKTHVHAKGKAISGKVSRMASMAVSPRASYFYIFDAASTLISNRDDDGYYSEFRVRFDADTDFDDAWVYAKLYLRRNGESDWQLYHISDDFIIDGRSDSDDYFVTTILDAGFPTSEYDVLIDLYESDRDGIVATIEPFDSASLSLLPLEEIGLDVPIEISGYSIEDVSTTLLIDDDGDDHYSKFRITFDPDADFTGALAYVRVWIRARGGEWVEEFVSEDFVVDSTGSADAYAVTIDWVSGYPTSFYDVQIDMYDASTNLLAASAGSERPQLAQIPLEDQSRDRSLSPPVTGGGGSTSSSERGGGGALTIWWAVGLFLLALGRARHRVRA
jgi:hypothetical protein